MATLALHDVTFGYGRRPPVLRGFSFEFAPGSTLMLGPNGAGKSTLLGLAVSALRPQAGRVTLGEVEASGSSLRTFRRLLAWMPQRISPIPGLTVREQVAYAGWLKGMARAEAWDGSLPALARVDLADHAGRSPRDLSGGELRRLGVAQTLVHRARWLLMDEPTAGLDPAQRMGFQDLIAELDVDLVVSTHQTDDISSTYGHVLVLAAGEVRFHGPTRSFLGLAAGDRGARDAVVGAYRRALAGP